MDRAFYHNRTLTRSLPVVHMHYFDEQLHICSKMTSQKVATPAELIYINVTSVNISKQCYMALWCRLAQLFSISRMKVAGSDPMQANFFQLSDRFKQYQHQISSADDTEAYQLVSAAYDVQRMLSEVKGKGSGFI